MAKFTKVVNLWDADVYAGITSGRLVLQRGQYVSCGGKPYSRWIGYNGCTMEVAHGGNGKEVRAKFNRVCEIKKATVARFGKE